MLSGKVIKGINAGNVVFHHRTLQIIARQQTICWQWPFFLSLRDTGISTLGNAIMQDKGSKEANSSWTWDLCLGCAFLLGLIWTLDVDECSSGMGGLQDPSWRRPPRSAPPERHLGGAALTEARGSDPTISFKSTVLIQKQTWRKVLLPTKMALPSTAVPWCDSQVTSAGVSSTTIVPGPPWRGKALQDLCSPWLLLPDTGRGGGSHTHLQHIPLCLVSQTQPHVPPTLNIFGIILGNPSAWVNQAGMKLLLPPLWPPDWKHLSSSQTNI